MDLTQLSKQFTPANKLPHTPRPFINHSVEFKKVFSIKDRLEMLQRVGYNVFFFPAEMISGCDLLSDSGTTTMTNEQWASLHIGDESYGSNKGYFLLLDTIAKTFGKDFANPPELGKPNVFLFHQGRPCEDTLFSSLSAIGSRQIIPSNGHFDTTHANIEANKIKPINLFSKELKDKSSLSHFKGNMSIDKLKITLNKYKHRIPIIYLTITNNTGGGQPVSMHNIETVSRIAHAHTIPLFFDACRFAENAWFIKQYEKGYKRRSISSIVQEMFSYVDGFTISFKKDGLANMGGGIFLKHNGLFVKKYPRLPDELMNKQITREGHPTYGGMSGRDIMTLVSGLTTIIDHTYLSYRIKQVAEFGEYMQLAGLPVVTPIGGHAVYMDMNDFFKDTKHKPSDYAGIGFTALLLGLYGHRACELGNFAFGSYNEKTKMEILPEVNFVRFAVPRLRYETQDLLSTADAVKELYTQRHNIPKVKVTYGKELPLRHFKAKFSLQI